MCGCVCVQEGWQNCSLLPHTLMDFHGTLAKRCWDRGTHATPTKMESKVIQGSFVVIYPKWSRYT